jgi:hypothetical protein
MSDADIDIAFLPLPSVRVSPFPLPEVTVITAPPKAPMVIAASPAQTAISFDEGSESKVLFMPICEAD